MYIHKVKSSFQRSGPFQGYKKDEHRSQHRLTYVTIILAARKVWINTNWKNRFEGWVLFSQVTNKPVVLMSRWVGKIHRVLNNGGDRNLKMAYNDFKAMERARQVVINHSHVVQGGFERLKHAFMPL